ncbi:MAG: hypothetical protein JRJ15_12490 [Deltaproteobacteria bacterium]|nr:hypothetical protein [Deltaproteobacteria bacterium]
MDFAPTFLELAGATYPTTYNGKSVEQPRGKSMVHLLSKKSSTVRGPDEAIGWEYNNLKAIRIGDHKATWIAKPFGPSEWQVFDLSVDPGESKDLSSQNPKLRQRLIDAWDEYAKSVQGSAVGHIFRSAPNLPQSSALFKSRYFERTLELGEFVFFTGISQVTQILTYKFIISSGQD